MNKCSLCGRKISSNSNHFGLNCLKKSCKLLDIKNVKNLNGEKTINKKIMKTLKKSNLSTEQQTLLTNRYLTLKLLEQVDMNCYNNVKESIRKDIEKIDSTVTEKDLVSIDTMPLNYANQILNLYLEYNLSDKLWNNEEDCYYKENIAFDTILFGFSYYYNKKPYLSGMLQQIQKVFWKLVVKTLHIINCDCSADFLEHSLQAKPNDIIIQANHVIIDKIKKDLNFKNYIRKVIKRYGTKKYFNTAEYNTDDDREYKYLNYVDSDLKLALNNTNINVIGNRANNKWRLEITITDIYDFTDYKEIIQFINANGFLNFAGNFANNVAMISTSCGVINDYKIKIKFKMEY